MCSIGHQQTSNNTHSAFIFVKIPQGIQSHSLEGHDILMICHLLHGTYLVWWRITSDKLMKNRKQKWFLLLPMSSHKASPIRLIRLSFQHWKEIDSLTDCVLRSSVCACVCVYVMLFANTMADELSKIAKCQSHTDTTSRGKSFFVSIACGNTDLMMATTKLSGIRVQGDTMSYELWLNDTKKAVEYIEGDS